MDEYRLTTIDNPYDPFTQYEEWAIFDKDKGYNTAEYLARITDYSEDMSESSKIIETNRAIDEILALNPLKIYKKVSRKSF